MKAEIRCSEPVDYIRKGYRCRVCGVDNIYYRIEDNTVEIMNILGNQDTSEALS
jgi:toxin ParE1/3/4